MTTGKERDKYEGLLLKPRIDYMLFVAFVVLILWFIVFGIFIGGVSPTGEAFDPYDPNCEEGQQRVDCHSNEDSVWICDGRVVGPLSALDPYWWFYHKCNEDYSTVPGTHSCCVGRTHFEEAEVPDTPEEEDDECRQKTCSDGSCVDLDDCCSNERTCSDNSCVDWDDCCSDDRTCTDGSCVDVGGCCLDDEICLLQNPDGSYSEVFYCAAAGQECAPAFSLDEPVPFDVSDDYSGEAPPLFDEDGRYVGGEGEAPYEGIFDEQGNYIDPLPQDISILPVGNNPVVGPDADPSEVDPGDYVIGPEIVIPY